VQIRISEGEKMAVNPKCSKKFGLSRLKTGWREAIFASIKSPNLKRAVAVTSACGCRPCELETGVEISLQDGLLYLEIQGAKVDVVAQRGQPLRIIEVDTASPWGEYLLQQVSQTEEQSLVVRYDAGGISQRLREKSKELWPRRKSLVSAYSYRHFLSQLMKQAKEGREKIAATLGHACDYSQTAYGSRKKKGQTDQHFVLNAITSNPVRKSAKHDKLVKLKLKHAVKPSDSN
jgi:hypothetical protein